MLYQSIFCYKKIYFGNLVKQTPHVETVVKLIHSGVSLIFMLMKE